MANIILFNKETLLSENLIIVSNIETIVVENDRFLVEVTDEQFQDFLRSKQLLKYKNNEIIKLPEQPSRHHFWSNQDDDWVLDDLKKLESDKNEVRDLRDFYLKELDIFVQNPLRFSSFTDAQKQEIAMYRTDLLNVPQQNTFPIVVFPIKPTFFL